MPVLFLSTKNQEEDRLKGYDTGADDYISKPFSMPELLKKIEVFLRRSKKLHSESIEDYTIGNILFSFGNLKITTPGETFSITHREADLLKFFANIKTKWLKEKTC
jgi:DNA-binding response OmpR family regulator